MLTVVETPKTINDVERLIKFGDSKVPLDENIHSVESNKRWCVLFFHAFILRLSKSKRNAEDQRYLSNTCLMLEALNKLLENNDASNIANFSKAAEAWKQSCRDLGDIIQFGDHKVDIAEYAEIVNPNSEFILLFLFLSISCLATGIALTTLPMMGVAIPLIVWGAVFLVGTLIARSNLASKTEEIADDLLDERDYISENIDDVRNTFTK